MSFGSPVTKENLDQVKEDAEQFLKEFSIKLALGYGEAMFEKVRQEQEGEGEKKWKLSHRDWNSVPRDNLYCDYIWAMTGAGAGDFDGWKKLYVVERQDYQLDIYKDEKAHKSGKKPSDTIQPVGYKLVTENVASYYNERFTDIANGIGMSAAQAENLTADMSSICWALAHPYRTNYIFQMKKGTNSSGGCCPRSGSVKPAEEVQESAEEAEKRQTAVECMQRCIRTCQPRDKNSILSLAFGIAWERLKVSYEEIQGWSDDGTEAEILSDLLMQICLSRQRDELFKNLQGPETLKLKLYYKASKIISTTITKILEVAWKLAQKGVEEVQQKIEPTLKQGISKILEVKKSLETKVKGTIQEPVGKLLGEYVTPFLKPLLDAFEKPLKDSFNNGRALILETIKLQDLPADKKSRDAALDKVARDGAVSKRLCEPLSEISQSLSTLKSLQVQDFVIFEAVDSSAIISEAEMLLLESVDAVLFTIEERLDAGQPQDTLLDAVLKDYDYDIIIARSQFMQDVAWNIFFSVFKKATAPVTDPAIQAFNGAVPEEVKMVLNIEKIIEDIITFILREPIDQMIRAAYPLPK